MSRVIHFELPIDDPERAIAFYEKALGWKIEKWQGPEDYWLVMTGDKSEPGIDGGLTRRGTAKATTNTIGVESIDEATRKIVEAGGRTLGSKETIPGVGYQQYCVVTEGNVFGIMQPDMTAK